MEDDKAISVFSLQLLLDSRSKQNSVVQHAENYTLAWEKRKIHDI